MADERAALSSHDLAFLAKLLKKRLGSARATTG